MNVSLQDLGPCKKQLRVEIDANQVNETFGAVAKDFQKHTSFPGFRPGKASMDMVLRKYEKDIEEETRKKLVSDGYRAAVTEKKLNVLGYPDIEMVQFDRTQGLQFLATVETSPVVELPDYKGLPVKQKQAVVTEADIDRALTMLRERQVKYNSVERPLAKGDIAVVNYNATCEGKPLTDIAPTAKGMTTQQNFWINTDPDNFLPHFAEQLLGASKGDKRTVTVDFPADFVPQPLAGRQAVYEVELVEIREKLLPPLDEAFAKSWGAESMEQLTGGVKRDLQNELDHKQKRDVRQQLVKSLMDRVTFDLPESAVAQETKNMVYDIVRENTQRGIPKDVLENEKESIYATAANSAKDRVKAAFILQNIAEKENIKVTQEEVLQRINALASMYNITPQKFIKDLQKRNAIHEIVEQISNEKVLDFLMSQAVVENVNEPVS